MTAGQVDLVIRRALLVDGLASPARHGDLAIRGDSIVAIGELSELQGTTEIDAAGKVLAPGFIDAHTHDDRAILSDPLMACKVSQGVTTVVTGNCGLSLAPIKVTGALLPEFGVFGEGTRHFYQDFSAYAKALADAPPTVNALCLVGHSTLRADAMGTLDRPATADEIKTMRRRLEASLDAGAIGLSTCLADAAAECAPTEEVIELAKSLPSYNAMYSTHLRNEADGVAVALDEALTIGRTAGVALQVSHHKCAGRQNYGRSRETLKMFDQARPDQVVGLDAYPYTAASTILDPRYIKDASRTIVAWSRARPEVAGRDLAEVAAEMGCSVEEASDELQPAGAIYFMMDEEDVRRILSYPHTMIGSDGSPHDDHPHPRLWGAFPRLLGHYVREVGLLTLDEAVRRMTSLPASHFGVDRRGVLREGAYADLVLFDPETVIDRASFDRPRQAAAGISMVFVNGELVWDDGGNTGKRPGRVLRRH